MADSLPLKNHWIRNLLKLSKSGNDTLTKNCDSTKAKTVVYDHYSKSVPIKQRILGINAGKQSS
jgi:hypothetical protein